MYDAQADPRRDEMALWLLRPDGSVERRGFAEPLRFYVHAPGRLAAVREALAPFGDDLAVQPAERLLALGDPAPRPVLEVAVLRYRSFRRAVDAVDRAGTYRDHHLFDVDLDPAARFLARRGLFPLARVGPGLAPLDAPWDVDVPPPPLRVAALAAEPAERGPIPRLGDAVGSARVGEAALEQRDGDEAALLRGLVAEVQRQDPHVLLTEGGDGALLPWLAARAAAVGLEGFHLGRAQEPLRQARRGRSYASYGRVLWRAPYHLLPGRWHIDAANSMFWDEGGLPGICDVARISAVPVPKVARMQPGTAITTMQVHRAADLGYLVPWKKNFPERFKSGLELLAADRGGYIFEPRAGLHEGVVELDFRSMYPSVMVSRNISPETLDCACCAAGRGVAIPRLGRHTCARSEGFVPGYLRPLIARRDHYQRLAAELPAGSPEAAAAEGIRRCLKWCLLVSFGYQGYRNARFGRIECTEAITAWAQELLLAAAEQAEAAGWDVLHGIVDSLWLRPARPGALPAEDLAARIGAGAGVGLKVEERYDWVVFLPSKGRGGRDLAEAGRAPEAVGALNRYYGRLEGGGVKARGVELRRSDTPPFVAHVQEALLATLAQGRDAAGVRARIPACLRLLRAAGQALDRGEVPGAQLAVRTVVTRPLAAYRARTAAVGALRHLASRGVRLEPGQALRYVVTDAASGDLARRALPAELWTPAAGYDALHYRALLARAAESLLLPFGWTAQRIAAAVAGTVPCTLDDFLPTAEPTLRRQG